MNDAPQPADLIFVMAGRMERKHYGLELYYAGFAPRLVLSVGRFEVSKMCTLNLEGADGLRALRDQTLPEERHFFLKVDRSGIRAEKIKLLKWNTYGEALGLRELVEQEGAWRVILVSTDIHLRRVARTFSRVFRGSHVDFLYCAVPPHLASTRNDGWWRRPDDRRYVLKELAKLAGYEAILSMPEWATRRLMRLKN